MKNLVALAHVLGAISRPLEAYKILLARSNLIYQENQLAYLVNFVQFFFLFAPHFSFPHPSCSLTPLESVLLRIHSFIFIWS